MFDNFFHFNNSKFNEKMAFFVALAIAAILPIVFLLLTKWQFSYWKRKGVAQFNPELFYGDLRDMLIGKKSTGENFRDLYFIFKNLKVKQGGIYWLFKPIWMPVDLNIIKNILQKDFMHFTGRGFYNHHKDILTHNLFRMDGEAWKNLRAKLTPTFTSSRMKMMFETLCEKNQRLRQVMETYVEDGGILNIRDISARFTTDVIASCGFGIECDSLKNPDCEFRTYGIKIDESRLLRAWLETLIPWKLLGYTGYRHFAGVEDFFRRVVMNTIQYRTENNIYRKDFMHLLLQLRNKGFLTDDGDISKDSAQKGILTDEEIIAQCFLFFGAGFDTSASSMTFAVYELARNPDIQDKVRQEIREVLQKYNGKLTYEAAKDLVYTEKVICETLRKYPAAPFIPRICNKRYEVPGTNTVIEKGTMVIISAWGLHMDPEYFPNPEVFDPERFSEEEKLKRPEFCYLPFGEGPRICIGLRFGILQAKVGLAGLLKDFKYSFTKDTPYPLEFKKGVFLLHAQDDIVTLKVEKA